MKRLSTISIKEPCTQSWNEMSPDSSGRFCASCQKTVVDFTKFTNEELISYFQQRKNFGCGRFTENQLSISIPQRPKRLTFWTVNKFAAASLIAALGFSFKGSAQVRSVTPTHSISERVANNIVSERLIVIGGIIKDEQNEGVPGASVEVQDLSIATITDLDGRFQLSIPQSSLKNGFFYLEVKSIGYEVLIKAINQRDYYSSVSIELKLSPSLLGGISVYRPTKWQRFKWWVKNNFLN
ncbi:MAG: carboxypeptidase-like regulatory domain-containing protein [Taibaiella sp.]|jgi:hypothetical protein